MSVVGGVSKGVTRGDGRHRAPPSTPMLLGCRREARHPVRYRRSDGTAREEKLLREMGAGGREVRRFRGGGREVRQQLGGEGPKQRVL